MTDRPWVTNKFNGYIYSRVGEEKIVFTETTKCEFSKVCVAMDFESMTSRNKKFHLLNVRC